MSHSVSSLDPEDEERLRQVSVSETAVDLESFFTHIFPPQKQDFDVFASQQPDTEPTSQTGLAAAAALVHGHAPASPIPPTTPTPPAGHAEPDTTAAAQTVALIHAEQQQQQQTQPQQQQVATIGQEKSTQEKVRDLDQRGQEQEHTDWSLF